MEMHQLRYFTEVVHTGNFTRAAELCNVTQPTLSHQLKKLEEEIGEPLLQRRKSGAVPTTLGQAFYQRARNILQELESARHEAASFRSGVQGELKIGVIPTIAPYFLPDVLQKCRKNHPGIRFQVAEEPTETLLAAMRAGQVDVSILSPPIRGGDMQIHNLFEDELLAAVPAKHPLSRFQEIDIKEMSEHPIILLNEIHCLRGQSIGICRSAGFEPDVEIQSSQLDTVIGLVEAGLGVSLIPSLSRHSFKHRKVVFRALSGKGPTRWISLVWPQRALQTRASRAFLEVCASVKSAILSSTSSDS